MPTWKRDFASGLIVLLPIMVTLYLVFWVFSKIAAVTFISGTVENPVLRVILTLVVFVLVVFAFGYLMRTTLGSLVEEYIDTLFNRLPGLRVVYNASKLGVQTAVTGTGDLQKPVKVTVWEGMRMTAFKTGTTTEDGRETLFLPTSPNVTTGYVIEVEPDDYEETDETVEQALTRVLSAGFGDTEHQEVAETLFQQGASEDVESRESRRDEAVSDDDANRDREREVEGSQPPENGSWDED
ncbi:MAG: DUF502 domain-containing protein [Halodesulfurarchaeum sp.]